MLATVGLDGVPVQLASTHLENRTDAAHRAEQMEVLLRALDDRSDGGPAVVGGDFNTLGATYAQLLDRPLVRRLRQDEPTRFTWPVPHEPLFEVARAHGFTWTDANVAAPTTEHDAGGLPDHVPIKVDWILVRGLVARRPAVFPSGGPVGPPPRLGRRATPMTVIVLLAPPADATEILAVVGDAFSFGGTRDAGRGARHRPGHLVGPVGRLLDSARGRKGRGRRRSPAGGPGRLDGGATVVAGLRPCASRRRTSSTAPAACRWGR